MKNSILFLFSIILTVSLFSCREDEDLTDITMEVPPAEELTTLDANGRVMDENGALLADAAVELYDQNGQLLAQTTSDADGQFSVLSLQVQSKSIIVQASKSDHHPAMRKMLPLPENVQDIQLRLPSEEVYPEMGSFSAAIPNQIIVEGSVLDDAGNPVTALVVTLIDEEPYYVGITDQEGNYQAPAPFDSPFDFYILNLCGSELATFALGPFTEDQTLDDIIASQFEYYTVTGTLLDCDGNPMPGGYALIDWSPSVITSVYADANGDFSFNFSDCLELNDEILITGFDPVSGTVSNLVTLPLSGSTLDAGDISVCSPNVSNISFEYEGESYSFQPCYALVVTDSITDPNTGQTYLGETTLITYQSQDGEDLIALDIAGAEPGIFFLRHVVVKLDGEVNIPVFTDPAFFTVEATFSQHANTKGELIIGDFGGTFISVDGDTKEIEGTFSAQQQ